MPKVVKAEKDLEFKDVTNEVWREYVFPLGFLNPKTGEVEVIEHVVRIEGPVGVHVSASGGHRVFTKTLSFYVRPGWSAIRWPGKDGITYQF